MIKPEDAEFHARPTGAQYWTETIGFWFTIPEAKLYGNVYVLARPEIGATIASVNVIQGMNSQPYTVDFTDPQMHAPCPPSMLHFDLGTGLRVDCFEPPTAYRFQYNSYAEGACSFDLTFKGCMPAWDATDPNENPLLKKSEDHEYLGLGDAWAGGHLDYLGKCSGWLELRGQRYEFEEMAGIDRSWGTRREFGPAAISYIHIPFDETFGIHVVTGIELLAGRPEYEPFRFGYIYDDGKVTGVVKATVESDQIALLPHANLIHVTDEHGREFSLRGVGDRQRALVHV